MKEEVQISLSTLIEDLDNGLTWLISEDAGYGSIQKKYGARDRQIDVIRRHPALVDIEPNLKTFTIIDDVTPKADVQPTLTAESGDPQTDIQPTDSPGGEVGMEPAGEEMATVAELATAPADRTVDPFKGL